MIDYREIKELVTAWGLQEHVIEKDYCLGWALKGIASHPELREQWVFKGGTCLKKCYIETYRFSEDLDFTVLDPKYVDINLLQNIFKQITANIETESGIKFTKREHLFRQRGDYPTEVEGRLYYIGPRNTPMEASIKLDLSASEKVIDIPVFNNISHPYSDAYLVAPFKVKCYSFNELFAEKIRAMGERCRPRDLYDIISIFRRDDFIKKPHVIHNLLHKKCKLKGIHTITLSTIQNSKFKYELINEWESMLGHQLPALPSFEIFWNELPLFFEWLDTGVKASPLPVFPLKEGEQQLEVQTVFTSASEKYYGFSMESIRFAAVNRLYVELGYNGKVRLIEPYSLRTTREGNLLLCAVKESGESRTYRIDRIESVKVTNKPFIPRYVIEFPAAGRINAPLIQRNKTSFNES